VPRETRIAEHESEKLTDAQRGHRLRQKVYVRQLKEIVKDLNTQNSRDERLLALQTEKARL
jgi:hypothetical protein